MNCIQPNQLWSAFFIGMGIGTFIGSVFGIWISGCSDVPNIAKNKSGKWRLSSMNYCVVERENPCGCGIEGKNFIPKESIDG